MDHEIEPERHDEFQGFLTEIVELLSKHGILLLSKRKAKLARMIFLNAEKLIEEFGEKCHKE